jgi:hypothetical protein
MCNKIRKERKYTVTSKTYEVSRISFSKNMSETRKGKNNPNYGNHNTAWNKGKKLSKEHIRKMSKSLSGRKLSIETKQKMSESARKRHRI